MTARYANHLNILCDPTGVVVTIMGNGHLPGIVGSVGEALGTLRS